MRYRTWSTGCLIFGASCFDPLRAMETHGDYLCTDHDGGMGCRLESSPKGYAKLVRMPFGLEGEINDVRETGSPALEWYFEIGVRWIPKTPETSAQDSAISSNSPSPKTALRQASNTTASRRRLGGEENKLRSYSFHNFAGPGEYSIAHQKTYVLTFPTPTRWESIFWYTGRLQHGGQLLRLKLHAHNNLFEQSLFFAASPEQLGITPENGFGFTKPFIPTRTDSVGFANNSMAREAFMRNLKKSILE